MNKSLERYIFASWLTNMRLTEREVKTIKTIFLTHFGGKAHLWLFGSRVDDAKKGGDIDLYVETEESDLDKLLRNKRQFLIDLYMQLGEQKIDVVLNQTSLQQKLPIYEIAKTTGVKLV